VAYINYYLEVSQVLRDRAIYYTILGFLHLVLRYGMSCCAEM